MASKQDIDNWNNYKNNYYESLRNGLKNGLVRVYDEELLSKLRHIYCGGVPASILLLTQGYANGHCYDRARLVTMAFGDDDYETITGSVKGLRIRPDLLDAYRAGKTNDLYADHCVAVRKEKDGREWVYDTSIGFIFDKQFYFELEDIKIREISNKEQVKKYLYYDFLQYANFEREKYVLPFIIPTIEETMVPTQEFYLEALKREIAILKEEINYDEMCQEIRSDMLSLNLICDI